MDDNKKIIKDDINFLEYPNWVVDRKNKDTSYSIEKENGKYEVMSPLGLPKHFDKIVLYYLLYKLYRDKNADVYQLTTTRYEIAKNVFSGVKDFGKNKFSRIMLALKKWNALSVHFDGVFYSNDEKTVRYFHIVDEVTLVTKTGALTIKFNESYVNQLKETTFYKLIDFEQYKKLHKTSSARLYEILAKTFKERAEWAINLQLLAEKLTFEKRSGAHNYYPSDVLRHLRPSVNEINKKTDLNIEFHYNKETGVCIFKKSEKKKQTFIPARKDEIDSKSKQTQTKKERTACLVYFKSLEEEKRLFILEDIQRQPFLKFLPDEDSRIYAYMTQKKLWKMSEK